MQNPLTLSQQDAVRRVAACVGRAPEQNGLEFYRRLFALDPNLRPLFKTDLVDQSHTVMTMLTLCMEGIDDRIDLRRTLEHLGQRHVEYGARLQDYATVRRALLDTLAQAMGDEWDPETSAAMAAALDWFMQMMTRNYPKTDSPEATPHGKSHE